VRWREKLKKKNYSKGQLKKVVKKTEKDLKIEETKVEKTLGSEVE
jgi:hypothetical protein